MSNVAAHVLLGLAIWLTVFTGVALAVKRRKASKIVTPSYILKICSIALLSFAPLHAAQVYWLTQDASLHVMWVFVFPAAFFNYLSRRAAAAEINPESAYSGMPLREKYAILFVCINSLVFGLYFSQVWNLNLLQAFPLFIALLVLTIVLSIVGTIAISLSHSPISEVEEAAPSFDERDRQVNLLSSRNAYFFIAPALVLLMIILIAGLAIPKVVHLGLAILIIAELVKNGSQVFYYHFGD